MSVINIKGNNYISAYEIGNIIGVDFQVSENSINIIPKENEFEINEKIAMQIADSVIAHEWGRKYIKNSDVFIEKLENGDYRIDREAKLPKDSNETLLIGGGYTVIVNKNGKVLDHYFRE